MVRRLTDKVSDILCVDNGIYAGMKLGRGRLEHRFHFFLISFQSFDLIADARKTTASLLHIIQLRHYACKDRK